MATFKASLENLENEAGGEAPNSGEADYLIPFGLEDEREYLAFIPEWRRGRVLRLRIYQQTPDGVVLETLFDDLTTVTDGDLTLIPGTGFTRFQAILKLLLINKIKILNRKHGCYDHEVRRDVEHRLISDLQAQAQALAQETAQETDNTGG